MKIKRRKLRHAALLSLLLVPLTGCWDSRDINDMNLVTMVILDKKEDQYQFFIELVNIFSGSETGSSGASGASSTMFSTLTGKGDTIMAARVDLGRKTDFPVFLGTVRSVVLTMDYAKTDIREYIYRIRFERQFRYALSLYVTETDPKELIETKPVNTISAGYSLEETGKTLVENGEAVRSRIVDILDKLSSDYVAFYIPKMDVKEEAIALTGYAIFKNGTSVGELDEKDSNGLIWIRSDNPTLYYAFPYKEGQIVTVLAELKGRYYDVTFENDQISIDCTFDIDASILYRSYYEPLTNQIKELISSLLKEKITSDLNTAIEQAQGFNSDYLRLNNQVQVQQPIIYRNLNWDEVFPSIAVNFNVNIDIDVTGMMDLNPYKEE